MTMRHIDSIPWDISAMELKSKLMNEQNDFAQSLSFWDELKGGAPGGTFATIITNVEGKSISPPRVEFDPFLRLPDGSKSNHICKAKLSWLPERVRSTNQWTSPFVMAMVNSQVVRWSHALQSDRGQQPWTTTYSESLIHPNFATAFVNYASIAIFGSLLSNPLSTYLMQRYLIPKPGKGPSMVDMETKRMLIFACSSLHCLFDFSSSILLYSLYNLYTQTFCASKGRRSAGVAVERNPFFI